MATLLENRVSAVRLDGGQAGSAPIFGVRAWVNFNGTGTVAIRSSGNVSSITDNGVGDYTVNFTTALPDANYAVALTAGGIGASDPTAWIAGTTTPTTYTTTAVRINTGSSAIGSISDANTVCVMVIG